MLFFVVFQILWFSYEITSGAPSTKEDRLSFATETSISVPTNNVVENGHLSTPRQTFRPPQTKLAHSFENAVRDAERAYYGQDIDDENAKECSAWGGTEVIDRIRRSKQSHLPADSNAKLETYSSHDFDIFMAQNAVIQVESNKVSPNQPPRVSMFLPEVDSRDRSTEDRLRLVKGDTRLAESTRKLQFISEKNVPKCDYTLEHPVFLMDADIKHWNWWFFHSEQLKMFVVYTVLQPLLTEEYMAAPPQMIYISSDGRYNRPNTDGLELLFTDNRRLHDSIQIWNAIGNTTNTTNYCFKDRLIWSPGATRGAGKILVNRVHPKMKCFSPIVAAYAAHLKASVHIPTIPSHYAIPYKTNGPPIQPRPRVIWVGRDNTIDNPPHSWQGRRVIHNQDEVTQYLQDNCRNMNIEMDVANFYDKEGSQTSYQEQAHFVSRANILIGVHGAGLNLAFFMPFNSVVVEIHLGTSGNKNSENTIAHLGGGGYIMVTGRKDRSGNLDKEQAWQHLEKAIQKWEEIQVKNNP